MKGDKNENRDRYWAELILLFGLVEEDKIILKKEKDFSEQEKQNIEKAIEETIVAYIREILEQEKITLSEVSGIGIASPRNK